MDFDIDEWKTELEALGFKSTVFDEDNEEFYFRLKHPTVDIDLVAYVSTSNIELDTQPIESIVIDSREYAKKYTLPQNFPHVEMDAGQTKAQNRHAFAIVESLRNLFLNS
jgi:methylaspartate ammonia-lyase